MTRLSDQPLYIGLIGTGFAARKRAESLTQDARTQLKCVYGADPIRTKTFSDTYQIQGMPHWQALITDPQLDLIIISTVNAWHGDMVQAALEARKHVVVEYPLSLDLDQAKQLIDLAERHQCLLHVEHIERLGGLHRATAANLHHIGQPHYVNYRTINPKHPAPKNGAIARISVVFL